MLDIYDYKMVLFENGKPEELPLFLWGSKNTAEDTGATSVPGHIQCLHTLIHGESLHEFEIFWDILVTLLTENQLR